MDGELSVLSEASLRALKDDEVEYELFLYILDKIIGENYEKKYAIVSNSTFAKPKSAQCLGLVSIKNIK